MRLIYKIGLAFFISLGLLFTIFFISTYEPTGCISGDCFNGHGTMKFSNGNVYTGYWKNGFMHGYGKQIMGSGGFEGDIYEGDFVHGEYDGMGTYFYIKYNSKLIGQFKNGKPNGNCTVYFGNNSLWAGSYSGIWTDGQNIDFEEYIKRTKKDELFINNAVDFYDSINYHYNKASIQVLLDQAQKIYSNDIKKNRVFTSDVVYLIENIQDAQINITHSTQTLKTFMEYDSLLPYRDVTIDYLNAIKSGFGSELSNWLLILQHNPSEDKPILINEELSPYVERVKSLGNTWNKVKDEFKDKYNIN